jgi:predicted amidohydrolase
MMAKVAVVQPQSFRGPEEERNVERALNYLDEAARQGARLVSFPEGYPGPYNSAPTWSAADAIAERARRLGVYVVFGTVEPAPQYAGAYHLALKLVGPDGALLATYYRVQPNTPEVDRVLMGDKVIVPGDELRVHASEVGRLGLLICSEVWCPELPRLLALQGMEILVAPIGGLVYELREAWRTLLWARAIENHAYVLTSQHLYGMEDGLAMIAGPERIEAESAGPGVLTAEIDLSRLEWLRTHTQTLQLPKPYRAIPGLLRYRRPDLYGPLAEPQADQYDFYYYRKGEQKSAASRR